MREGKGEGGVTLLAVITRLCVLLFVVIDLSPHFCSLAVFCEALSDCANNALLIQIEMSAEERKQREEKGEERQRGGTRTLMDCHR